MLHTSDWHLGRALYGRNRYKEFEKFLNWMLKTLEKQKIDEDSDQPDLFFNVEYTGLDLNGNRYSLKSEEAYLDDLKPEIVFMKNVHAVFYFKNGNNLDVWSDKGIYNNKNLDMKFQNNVKAKYQGTDLFANKAEYSNSKSYLSISENVKVDDIRGNLIADKLLDITKKLDITSFNDGKINANVNLNEKGFRILNLKKLSQSLKSKI